MAAAFGTADRPRCPWRPRCDVTAGTDAQAGHQVRGRAAARVEMERFGARSDVGRKDECEHREHEGAPATEVSMGEAKIANHGGQHRPAALNCQAESDVVTQAAVRTSDTSAWVRQISEGRGSLSASRTLRPEQLNDTTTNRSDDMNKTTGWLVSIGAGAAFVISVGISVPSFAGSAEDDRYYEVNERLNEVTELGYGRGDWPYDYWYDILVSLP